MKEPSLSWALVWSFHSTLAQTPKHQSSDVIKCVYMIVAWLHWIILDTAFQFEESYLDSRLKLQFTPNRPWLVRVVQIFAQALNCSTWRNRLLLRRTGTECGFLKVWVEGPNCRQKTNVLSLRVTWTHLSQFPVAAKLSYVCTRNWDHGHLILIRGQQLSWGRVKVSMFTFVWFVFET